MRSFTTITIVLLGLGMVYAFYSSPNRAEIMGTSQVSFDLTTLVDSIVTQYHQNPAEVTILVVVAVFLMVLLRRRQ